MLDESDESSLPQKPTGPMPEPDQTNPNELANDGTASEIHPAALSSGRDASAEPQLRIRDPLLPRLLMWLATGVAIAFVAGLLASAVPPRFRLLGLLAIAQGGAIGAVLGRAALPMKMHYSRIGASGGVVCGIGSVLVTAAFWWQAWATQIQQPVPPRPDAVIAAQMIAQMPKPTAGDTKQLKAYEETRQNLQAFLDAEAAPPETGFDDWLIHRASALVTDRNLAVLIGLAELLLAGISAAWFARQAVSTPFCLTCQNWRRTIRFQNFFSPLPESLRLMIPEPDRQTAGLVTAELSACGCEARPIVNLDIEMTDRQLGKRLKTLALSDEQFAELKRLMDEAQGMK
jgi:hypothetical protein